MNISIDYPTLYATVARSLSIIGKRSTDDNGNLLFKDITLGSREKTIILDFFYSAFVDICAELNKFLTAEVENHSDFSSVIYTTFWTDQQPSAFVDQITANGQYLFTFSDGRLYVSSLTFPFSTISPVTDQLFVYDGTYYRWNSGLTQLTEEQTALLTDEEKAAAIVLSYYNTNPSSVTVTRADVYLYYNGAVYKSARSASFSNTSIPAGTALVDPNGHAYVQQGVLLVNVSSEIEDSVTLTITMPDNWNSALLLPLRKAVSDYCVAYALYSWFVITAPRISEKYIGDMQRNLAAVIRLIHEKKTPATPLDGSSHEISPLSISTTVTDNN